MQNKINLNINTGGRYHNALTNNPPAKTFSIENAPIHSMKKDLEMIDNPEMMRQESAPLPISSNSSNPQPYASSSKISPFLEKTASAPTVSILQKKPATIIPSAAKESLLEQETPASPNQSSLKKVLVFSTIFLSLIALGVGSYYFWLVRGGESEPVAEAPSVVIPIEEPSLPAAIVEPEIKIEEPKENTLVLDLVNLTSAQIKTEIKSQIEKLPQDSLLNPVEFKLRDPQNNLIPFSSFAKKSGITFAQSLSAYLGESFSLLAFNDNLTWGIGLIVESKNDLLLKPELLKKESLLIANMDVLLLEKFTKPAKISFSDNNTYQDLAIRYFNIISPEKLTIDYAIAKNKLFFGTTRNTIYALYDLILSQSDSPL